MRNLHLSTRREILQIAAGGAMATIASSAAQALSERSNPSGRIRAQEEEGGGLNLLTNPRYMVGAKYRMGRFIGNGADPVEAERVFRSLPNLDPIPWVAAWSRLAEPWEQKAADFEKRGRLHEAMKAYQTASMYYSIAKFPVLNHPAKQAAYGKCVEYYLKAARHFDPPLERIVIQFEGKELVGYLRKPNGISKPPVVIHTGGIDVYNEDWDLTDFLDEGLATFRTDMPGAGQCPFWYKPGAERIYAPIIDYVQSRNDLDAKRTAFIGCSAGGNWGAIVAYMARDRLRASVTWGGPIHYTYQPQWAEEMRKEKLYLWPILDSFAYASHSKDADEWVSKAPAMSLKTQGWLEKPSCTMLAVNGALDQWVTIQDVYILYETGEPKVIRVYPNYRHMALEIPWSRQLIVNWLKAQLS